MNTVMSDEHRKILRENRVNLRDNIANPKELIDLLYVEGILTEILKEDVEALTTRSDKIVKILDIPPHRGEEAFDKFYQILIDSGNRHAASYLKPNTVDEELPSDWPNEQAMTEQIRVVHCDKSSSEFREKWTRSGQYNMTKKRRGRVVIINNKDFNGTEAEREQFRRDGTEKDRDRSKELFEQLHFEVVVYDNQTAQDIKNTLAQEASEQFHATADCFILTILSHGSKDGIYGVDWGVISMEEITGYFTSTSCPNLAGKPKIFFIQACRGDNIDCGGVANTGPDGGVANTGPDMSRISKILNEAKGLSEHDTIKDGDRVAAMRDMLIASATSPGFISLRNVKYGSWFIQAVIWVFAKHSHKMELPRLLKMVNRLVSLARGTVQNPDDVDVVQASCYTDSFIKDFYFFPGCCK